MDEIYIEITHNGKTFSYNSGAKAYIFHTGIYNEIHKKYGYSGLKEYVSLVFECYIHDDNRTPLGALADFIALNYKICKKMSIRTITEKFYEE